MKVRNLLLVSVFTSFTLLASSVCFSFYIFKNNDLSRPSMSTQKMDNYMNKISSMNNLPKLKEVYISDLELEKEQADIIREYLNVLFDGSIGILIVACSCLGSWVFYVKAVQKELKSLSAE